MLKSCHPQCRRARRGQLAIEFLIILGIAMLFLAVYFGIASQMLASYSTEQAQASLERQAYMIQRELLIASLVHDGYARPITVPQRADSFNYTISSTPGYLTLAFKTAQITVAIPNITGNITKGDHIITKSGGVISVS